MTVTHRLRCCLDECPFSVSCEFLGAMCTFINYLVGTKHVEFDKTEFPALRDDEKCISDTDVWTSSKFENNASSMLSIDVDRENSFSQKRSQEGSEIVAAQEDSSEGNELIDNKQVTN